MRILVHDYSGHPFQAELSRSLARRGHDVVHSYCAAYVSGKGRLAAAPGETVVFDPVWEDRAIKKADFVRRAFQEFAIGWALVRQVRRVRPDVVMLSNTPVPSMIVLVAALMVLRIPYVLWHQDVQAVAIRSFAGESLSRVFHLAASLIEVGERWVARRSGGVVVIADSFVDVHRRWRTADKVTVIPNWAPLDEIVPVERNNAWSAEHDLDEVRTLVYSGTLGLKHNPVLLVRLAARAGELGKPVRLVVVNEGPAVPVLQDEARRLGVDLLTLPFQPYERLSEVLGSADMLVVLLEQSAGAFSVPSKTLSYLCAGRPILGMMPAENLAAELIQECGGLVVAPQDAAVDQAAGWLTEVIDDLAVCDTLGKKGRALAEREFALDGCTDRFERILSRAAGAQLQ